MYAESGMTSVRDVSRSFFLEDVEGRCCVDVDVNSW